jgi:hypothetical protein
LAKDEALHRLCLYIQPVDRQRCSSLVIQTDALALGGCIG